jgi:arthrofactin-type cyclic lipopeptide synthetase C
VKIYLLGESDHFVSIIVDHLAADGVSLGIILGELRCLYQVIDAGTPHGFPGAAPQYRNFALWQRAWLRGDEAKAQRAYWRDQLADLSSNSGNRPGPALRRTVPFTLPPDTRASLAALCVRHRVTPFMALLAAYAPYLSETMGERDLVIGTVRANRRRPQAEGVVGHFANLIPLRLRIDAEWSWSRFFAYVRETCRSSYACEELPFAEIAAVAQAEHGIRGTRLTACTINFVPLAGEPMAWGAGLSMSQLWGLPVQELPATNRTSLFVCQQQADLSGTLLFDPDTTDPTWASALPDRLARVIASVARVPDERIGASISSDLVEGGG